MMNNPFLADFNTPFDTYPFDKIKVEHYLPAIKEGIKQGLADIDAIISLTEPATFANTIEALEKSGDLVDLVSTVFFNLNSSETSDAIQALAKDISPLLSDYGNDIILNEGLFKRVEAVFNTKESFHLNAEQQTLLEKTYKSFVRNGSKLNDDQKEKLRIIDKENSQASLTFEENVLAESNAYELVITNEADLSGLTEDTIEAAKLTAKEKGTENAWVFTLDYPSYIPFMTYSDNLVLKEQIFKAFASKGFKNNKNDNQAIVKKMANLRYERAILLGYKSHADFVLEERMAESPTKVMSFLTNLLDNSLSFAKK